MKTCRPSSIGVNIHHDIWNLDDATTAAYISETLFLACAMVRFWRWELKSPIYTFPDIAISPCEYLKTFIVSAMAELNGLVKCNDLPRNRMPLTEYAADPLPADFAAGPTEYKVPQEYILANGYPDVSAQPISPGPMPDSCSIFDSSSLREFTTLSRRRL